jgi:hypothetical protein
VDGRRAPAEETREKKRWVVEVRWPGDVKYEGWSFAGRESAEAEYQRMLHARIVLKSGKVLTPKVRLVEVVERRTVIETRQAASPIDPKLSDGGGWRAGCAAGGKAVAE